MYAEEDTKYIFQMCIWLSVTKDWKENPPQFLDLFMIFFTD